MTTQNHRIVNYCDWCHLEYVGGHCAPCPLCPLRAARSEADKELHAAKLYLVIEHTNVDAFEYALNGLSAGSWDVEQIHIGHSEDRDQGEPLYIAVFRRTDYDRERHVKATAARDDADLAYREKRQELEDQVRPFIVARAEGA